MDTELLTDILKLHEGLRTTPYRDTVGKLTIGYGHNLDDKPLTKRQCERLLADDIADVIGQCAAKLDYWMELSEVRQAVVADMVFNMGMRRFNGFVRMHKALVQKKYSKAAHEMLDSKWSGQVGERAERLSIMMESDHVPEI